MILIKVKSYCPVCGIHTTVEITPDELSNYKIKGILPYEMYEEAICSCCIDDGYKLNKETKEILECTLVCG